MDGPLSWSRNGGMFSYNLCCRENSFVQLWHQMGPNQRELTHCLSVHIDIEGNLTVMQGMPQRALLPEEPVQRSNQRAHTTATAATSSRPVRRSPRLRQNGGRYETISPSAEEVRAFDALLHANMTQSGKYDNSIHTTINSIHVIIIKVAIINI